jgi:predicted dehydrogenase
MDLYNKTEHLKVKWGVLGAARVLERILPAFSKVPNAELVAMGSRRPGAAEIALEKYSPETQNVALYDSLEGLLHDSTVEAVYIPLANHEHYFWALKAIEQGKHVLIEKPMTLNVAEIIQLMKLASERGLKIMEGFMFRFHPQHERVKEIIDSGLIGKVRDTHASFSFFLGPSRMYRLIESVSNGGGAMWDIGPYAIHTSRMWFDRPAVSVIASSEFLENGADISTSGILSFGEGRYAHFDVSFQRSRQSEYTVVGTKGGVRCHSTWQLPDAESTITWWTEEAGEVVEKISPANHFEREIQHFSECILNDIDPLLNLDDASENCKVINAVLDSARNGELINLS